MNTYVKKNVTISPFYDETLIVKDRHSVRTLYEDPNEQIVCIF